jgi:hypothetical protein
VKHLAGFRFTPDGQFQPWEIPSDKRFRLGPAQTR